MAPTLDRTESERDQKSVNKRKDSQISGPVPPTKMGIKLSHRRPSDQVGELDLETNESPGFKLERIKRKT